MPVADSRGAVGTHSAFEVGPGKGVICKVHANVQTQSRMRRKTAEAEASASLHHYGVKGERAPAAVDEKTDDMN